eukprot:3941132-Rhodomonas_salina.1
MTRLPNLGETKPAHVLAEATFNVEGIRVSEPSSIVVLMLVRRVDGSVRGVAEAGTEGWIHLYQDWRLRKEWEGFREHDILFLLSIRANVLRGSYAMCGTDLGYAVSRYKVGQHPPPTQGSVLCAMPCVGAEICGVQY